MSIKAPASKVLVEWSPHDAAFFALGTDTLSVYECQTQRQVATQFAPSTQGLTTSTIGSMSASYISRMTTQRQHKDIFKMVKTDPELTHIKCMKWCPMQAQPLLLAVGLGSGKVVLSDFEKGHGVCELVPPRASGHGSTNGSGGNTGSSLGSSGSSKSTRSITSPIACNAVDWSAQNPTQVAAGFEKVRADCCVYVWDINTQMPIHSVRSRSAGTEYDFFNNNLRQPHPSKFGMQAIGIKYYCIIPISSYNIVIIDRGIFVDRRE